MTASKKAKTGSKTPAASNKPTVVSTLTRQDAVTKKFETVQKMSDGTTRYKCSYCGKWITAESSIEMEAGSLCHHLREDMGLTDSAMKSFKRESPTVPAKHIKLASLDRICKSKGIAISKMVAATGFDRCIEPPIHEWFQVTYVGRDRWVPEQAASPEGLKMIQNCNRKRGETKPTAPKKVAKAASAPTPTAPELVELELAVLETAETELVAVEA